MTETAAELIRTPHILAVVLGLALAAPGGSVRAQVRAETAGAASFTHLDAADPALLDARFRLLFGAPSSASVPIAESLTHDAPFRGLFETPVTGARISSGFGMRLHPILGLVRMHDGIDYAAPWGSPVYAAGDGVVEQAQWLGGYGRWVKLSHPGGWETGYGHLSSWIVRPGEHVRQGQVIAYTGSTGLSTGPHLHYEVIKNGVKINPKGANAPSGTILAGRDLSNFKAEKAHIDAMLASKATNSLAVADASSSVRLRPSQTLTR